MTDKQLIELYWARSEDAIKQTERRYGRFCHALAYRILRSDEDAEECVNDTYLTVWNEIPPTRPNVFSAFLAKITRNLAIKRYHHHMAQKRRGEYTALCIEELGECLPDETQGDVTEDMVIREVLNRFLSELPERTRKVFLQRYFYACSVEQIARELHMGESNVKMTLMRARAKLKELLEKEGIEV